MRLAWAASVVAHSLGSVVAFETLHEHVCSVPLWVTLWVSARHALRGAAEGPTSAASSSGMSNPDPSDLAPFLEGLPGRKLPVPVSVSTRDAEAPDNMCSCGSG